MSVIEKTAAALYDVQWARLTFSAELRTATRLGQSRGAHDDRYRLVLGGSGRYRAELADAGGESWLAVSDGQIRCVIADGVGSQSDVARRGVPFAECLCPSWLLADFDFEITGSEQIGGRDGWVLKVTRRETSGNRLLSDLVPDRVTAVVDKELGILLRCARIGPRELVRTTEFTLLNVAAQEDIDSGLFRIPSNTELPRSPQDVKSGSETGSTFRPSQSMPRRSTPGQPVTSELINLMHRTALGPQAFVARLRESRNEQAILRAAANANQSAWNRGALRWLQDVAETDISDQTARLFIAMPGKYRVEYTASSPGGLASAVCDGEFLWRIYGDRVSRRLARPLPEGIALMIDPAWLLSGYHLSEEGRAEVHGRQGLQARAIPEDGSAIVGHGALSGRIFIAESVEVIIDNELGIALRQTWYSNDEPILADELSELGVGVAQDEFKVQVPPEARLMVDPSPLAEAGVSPTQLARKVASRAARDVANWLGRNHIGTG